MKYSITERLEFGPDGKVILPKLQPTSRPTRYSSRRRNSVESVASSSGTNCSSRTDGGLRPKPVKRKLSVETSPKNSVFRSEYVVEKILAHDVRHQKQMFLVKWKGWSQESNTWEPLENLSNCPRLLEEFLAESLEQTVLAELQEWLNINESLDKSELEQRIPKNGFGALPQKINLQRDLLKLTTISREKRSSKMFDSGTRAMYLYMLTIERERQVTKLQLWEEEINSTSTENAHLTVENTVDLEGPPDGFVYVNNYVPSDGIIIPDDPPIGCECEEGCVPRNKTCCFNQSLFPYRRRGRINVEQGTPIYECNKRCKCDDTCRNRVVQLGRKVPLCIFRTTTGCGWGVKTLRKIHNGEFVCEYVGEVISFEEAERRGRGYDAEGRTYLFDLDFNSHNDFPYTVDAATYGNVSHFINHSCQPNLAVWAVWVNCLDPNIPKLALFATREIERGEEITFDYMCNTSGVEPTVPTSPSRPRLTLPDDNGSLLQNCKCGAGSCRRYLF